MLLSKHLVVFMGLAAMFTVSGIISFSNDYLAFAENQTISKFTVLAGDQLKNNPVATHILEKIRQSKLILEELQKGKPPMTEHQKFVEEQRKIANDLLQADLARMNKKYEDFTPRNAFKGFLAGVNATYHDIYWGQFNYLDNKIQIARAAMQDVLDNGGSYQDARQAYFKYASMTRVEMIKVNQDLNIQYGFADPDVQKAFNKYGKLPRTRN